MHIVTSSLKSLVAIVILSGAVACSGSSTQTDPESSTSEKPSGSNDANRNPTDEKQTTVAQKQIDPANNGPKTKTFAGPYHIGDGILGTKSALGDAEEKEICFKSLKVPESANVGRAVELSFTLTGPVNGIKFKVGKSCGAPASYYIGEMKLMRDGLVIKNLGDLKYGGSGDAVSSTEVSVMKDELDGGFVAGTYKLSIQADQGNSSFIKTNGKYEDMAIADVNLTILSGDGSFAE